MKNESHFRGCVALCYIAVIKIPIQRVNLAIVPIVKIHKFAISLHVKKTFLLALFQGSTSTGCTLHILLLKPTGNFRLIWILQFCNNGKSLAGVNKKIRSEFIILCLYRHT